MSVKSLQEVERIDHICETCDLYEDLEITEAEYQGKKVKLNDPIRTSENPKKKFKVCKVISSLPFPMLHSVWIVRTNCSNNLCIFTANSLYVLFTLECIQSTFKLNT